MARITANYKQRTDKQVNITPLVWYNSEDLVKFPGKLRPAAWLPVQWVNDQTKDAFVISSGKVVALDIEGHVVPAGLATSLLTGSLVYTATDVTHGVIDLTTGDRLTAAVTYAVLDVAKALLSRGLVLRDDVSAVSAAAVIPRFIGRAIGVCAVDVFVWAGDSPAAYNNVNYRKQEYIGVYSRVQMILPMQTPGSDTTAFASDTLDTAGSETYVAGLFVDAGTYWDNTNLALLPRYIDVITASTAIVGLGLDNQPVAAVTDRTPFTCNVAYIALRKVASPDLVRKTGDYFLDAAVGVVLIPDVDWQTAVAATTTITFTYKYYTATAATAAQFSHANGRLKPGDALTFDVMSNLTLLTPTTVAHLLSQVGKVAEIQSEPQGFLEMVKTAWNFSGVPKEFQMPGTATKGFSDRITLTDEIVADQLAVVTIDVR